MREWGTLTSWDGRRLRWWPVAIQRRARIIECDCVNVSSLVSLSVCEVIVIVYWQPAVKSPSIVIHRRAYSCSPSLSLISANIMQGDAPRCGSTGELRAVTAAAAAKERRVAGRKSVPMVGVCAVMRCVVAIAAV